MVNSTFPASVGKKSGLEIWRIENFTPVAYDKPSYGKFYSGDSYIVLNTRLVGRSSLEWDIHFWLGKDTSQDEMGSAAIHALRLDEQLGGIPVQYRQVQDHESPVFMACFPNGVRYLDGGVASGFKHVDPNLYEKKLLQIKGKRNIRVRQVAVDVKSMNEGDCFVLDCNKVIYVYVGTHCKKMESMKAILAATQVRDQDHAGKGKIIILDKFSSEGEFATFFKELGSGSRSQVPSAPIADDDLSFETNQQSKVTLYQVSDASGKLQCQKVAEKPLQQSMMKSEDCYILDTMGNGIFVRIGKKCSQKEKESSMDIANKFLSEKNYPIWTQVNRVVDGGEPALFKQYFSSWKETSLVPQHALVTKNNRVSEFDIGSLHKDKLRKLLKAGGAAPGFNPDDGSGAKEIYRIENFELVAVDPKVHGMFFAGDSYVIKYSFSSKTQHGIIIYFWQGNRSSQDEKAASALQAMKMDNDMGGRAIQVRVTQDNEPRHFLKMFKGKMIIFTGGRASGFRNVHDYDSYDLDGTRLFQVRGYGGTDMRAVQVDEKASSLNSDDVFVLEVPTQTFIWIGKDASEEEKANGKAIADLVSPGHKQMKIEEGKEPEEFWKAVGGKGQYTTSQPDSVPILEPRLFHCILTPNGRLGVEEMKSFTQSDLVEDDVMVLDSGMEIYVWVGKDSTTEEQKAGFKMAQEYIKTEPSHRVAESALIFQVRQTNEPESFKDIFPTWSDKLWQV